MELAVAKSLISKGIDRSGNAQTWADLGAGKGLFTLALSTLLPTGSIVTAIDVDEQVLQKIPDTYGNARIEILTADFTSTRFPSGAYNGFLLANSLHFTSDKIPVLKRLGESLKRKGRLVVVEYDMTNGNPWVPYPITFEVLKQLAADTGFTVCKKLGTHPSRFNNADIYSALLERD